MTVALPAADAPVADDAARMDRIYRRQRHIYDLSRKYYLLGRDAMIRALDPPVDGTLLEVGCGTGRNLIEAARLYPQARLFGLDISAEMLATARANIDRAGLGDRIRLAQGDATGFDPTTLFGAPGFDRIFLSYTLSMIPDWRAAIDMATGIVADGGRLHLVDFGQQECLPAPFRRLLFAWLAKFDVTPRAELASALNIVAARHRLMLAWKPIRRGYAWSAVLDSAHKI
jgi:S-adenosylmethionine-diacylgycerolhomoserine-N-methlytransferase